MTIPYSIMIKTESIQIRASSCSVSVLVPGTYPDVIDIFMAPIDFEGERIQNKGW